MPFEIIQGYEFRHQYKAVNDFLCVNSSNWPHILHRFEIRWIVGPNFGVDQIQDCKIIWPQKTRHTPLSYGV